MRRLRRLRCVLAGGHDPTLMWFGDDTGKITGGCGCRRCRQPLVWGVHGRAVPR